MLEENKTHKIMRPGKTRKDRARGVQARNAENKARRAQWENDRDPQNPGREKFPRETCNGKKNRYTK